MKAQFKAITAALALVALVAVAAQGADHGPGNDHGPWLVEPGIRLARADDSSLTRYPAASRRASPAGSPARDRESGNWVMLLAGLLCAGAIARRRMSS